MPYTPPSNRSPASSANGSPNVSRRSSLQSGLPGSPRQPTLPRSSSYLTRHRRTPSASNLSDVSSGPLTPQGTSDDLKGMVSSTPSRSIVRQSPPPITTDQGMPNGAIISPPDSASSGSDDDGPEIRGRKKDVYKDLREAVSQIPQQRTPSPQRQSEKHLDVDRGVHISFSTSALSDLAKPRKKGHVRSATEPHIVPDTSSTGSEEETDEDLRKKPQMVRKKSGELVRPALRPSSRRRPSSMPGTPIFSKAVHFDSHLEHVRHFLQVDRPLAVSAGSSPAEAYESDNEYPFPGQQRSGTRSPPYEWEIITANFPHDSEVRKSLPVRVEKLWLSPDQKSMLGSVAVVNLAFHKSVTCRFTLDYWKTTSEVCAEYNHEIRPRDHPLGHDRFNFSIKLSDTANLESKTLYFCIRYNVDGRELWDNNAGANFQVDFRKKHLPQNGKNNFQGASSRPANGLPRSNRRSTAPRPKSMPVAFVDFGDDTKLDMDQPIHEYLGEESTGLRLKTKSNNNLASDNISKSLSSPSGSAFSNRYDFGASLSAAVQAAKDTMSREKDTREKDGGLYMKANVRPAQAAPFTLSGPPKPTNPTYNQPAPGTSSPLLTLPSASYEELVNKYCFFGSKQSSPNMMDGTMKSGRYDGHHSDDWGTGSTNSSVSSPKAIHHAGPATHHSLHLPNNAVSYFHSATPLGSPLKLGGPLSDGSSASTPKPATSARSASPAYAAFAGTSPTEFSSYHSPQPALAERFPWGGEAHAATAIRG